jgi:hypothetical protein
MLTGYCSARVETRQVTAETTKPTVSITSLPSVGPQTMIVIRIVNANSTAIVTSASMITAAVSVATRTNCSRCGSHSSDYK